MVAYFPESQEERESRILLAEFLGLTDSVLERVLERSVMSPSGVHNVMVGAAQLKQIWSIARDHLKQVIQSIRIGLSRTRREALERVGMFGQSLTAKFNLLSFDIEEGTVRRVMKRLNSMLGSLAKVFPVLDTVKEFKEHIEATMDSLQNPPEFITLKDLLA